MRITCSATADTGSKLPGASAHLEFERAPRFSELLARAKATLRVPDDVKRNLLLFYLHRTGYYVAPDDETLQRALTKYTASCFYVSYDPAASPPRSLQDAYAAKSVEKPAGTGATKVRFHSAGAGSAKALKRPRPTCASSSSGERRGAIASVKSSGHDRELEQESVRAHAPAPVVPDRDDEADSDDCEPVPRGRQRVSARPLPASSSDREDEEDEEDDGPPPAPAAQPAPPPAAASPPAAAPPSALTLKVLSTETNFLDLRPRSVAFNPIPAKSNVFAAISFRGTVYFGSTSVVGDNTIVSTSLKVPAKDLGLGEKQEGVHPESLCWRPDGRRVLVIFKDTRKDVDAAAEGPEVAMLWPLYGEGGVVSVGINVLKERVHGGRATAACFIRRTNAVKYDFATAGGSGSPYEVFLWREEVVREGGSDRAVYTCQVAHAAHSNVVNALAASREGILYSGGDDKKVFAWNLAVGKTFHTFDLPEKINWLGVGPSGELLVSLTSSKNNLVLFRDNVNGPQWTGSWDLKVDDAKEGTAAKPKAKGLSMYERPDLSACGNYVALGSKYGIVYVWDLRTHSKEPAAPAASFSLRGHAKAVPVPCVSFCREAVKKGKMRILAATTDPFHTLHLLSLSVNNEVGERQGQLQLGNTS